MQQDFWPEWADFLSRWKLKPLVCVLAGSAGPIMPVNFQILTWRAPYFGGGKNRRKISVALDCLDDATRLTRFAVAFKGAVC